MDTRDMNRKYVGERARGMFVPVATSAAARAARFVRERMEKANLD
jgi:hypothetical protein